MSDHATARLIMPLVDGEPKYRERLNVLDVNERYEDSCLVELPADEPNIDWVLQDPDVRRVGFDQPAPERDGPPTDLVDEGKEGVPEDPEERVAYERPNSERVNIKGISVIPPEDVKVEELVMETVKEDHDPELDQDVEEALSDRYDLSDAIFKQVIGFIEGDEVPLRREDYYIFPNAELGVVIYLGVTKEYRDSPVRNGISTDIGEDMKSHGVKDVLIYAYPGILDKTNETDLFDSVFKRDDSLPSNEDMNLYWYRLQGELK